MEVRVLCAALVLVVTSCGMIGGDDEADGGDGAAGDGVSAELTPSPLAELLGRDITDSGDPAAVARLQAEEDRQRQELIVGCMAEQGFDYAVAEITVADAPDGPRWGTRAWAERWGFGITTRWFPQALVGEELVGFADAPAGPATADANAEIVAALGPDEQAAWYAALYGGDTGSYDDGFSDGGASDDGFSADGGTDGGASGEDGLTSGSSDAYGDLGCEGRAYTEVASGDRTSGFEARFATELAELEDRIETDSRVVAARERVAECVTGQGLEFVTGQEYLRTVEPMLAMFQAELYPTPDFSADDLAAMTQDEIDAAFAQQGSLSPESQAQLADLQAREVELAVAGFDCQEGTPAYQATLAEVRAEHEQQFLDDHAAEVADFRTG